MQIRQTLAARFLQQQRKFCAWRGARALTAISNQTTKIGAYDVLVFCTLRNERVRLPYFLKYYRNLGVSHFLMIDNGSTDGSDSYLAQQPDVSLWQTHAGYKAAHFGMDWVNALLHRYANDHWALCVDVDEFFIYPFCESRPIHALTDWLEDTGRKSFGAMLLDMYPKGPLAAQTYNEGQDPLETAPWFDPGNYTIKKHHLLANLWIQGGPRARMMPSEHAAQAPALNKIPLVKWHKSFTYVSSTHALVPRRLNVVYETQGGEMASGCLLHMKFLDTLGPKAAEELNRRQHYKGGREYEFYEEWTRSDRDLWCKWSEKYVNWRQLEILGLMSKGNWA